MKKNPWKTWTWVITIVFLVLAFSAPFNPFLTTKASVYIWAFVMMAICSINTVIACYLGLPPKEISFEDKTPTDAAGVEKK